jgi:hypothetical protein
VGFPPNTGGNPGNGVRKDVEQFLLAFDTDLAPAVGQQVTLSNTNSSVATPRITKLVARAAATYNSVGGGAAAKECDLVVKGSVSGLRRGWVGDGAASPSFTPDDGGAPISLASLTALAATAGQELTFTCATPGSGTRVGINRDRDVRLDGQDNCPDVSNDGQADLTPTRRRRLRQLRGEDEWKPGDTTRMHGQPLRQPAHRGRRDDAGERGPSYGPVGQTVTLSGTGFGPSVQASFDGSWPR